jgi:retron-type reverse transcriptase
LRIELLEGRYRPRPFLQFTITDPKPRRIGCADFRDRVAHHALCAVIGPVIERRFTQDSYACRRGFGGHRAVARARHFTRLFPCALKTDIRRFYDSVQHARLLDLVRRVFQEEKVRALVRTIVGHPTPHARAGSRARPGCGPSCSRRAWPP